MVDGADADGWSSVAEGWSALWGAMARPAREVLMSAAGVTSGASVLDVGCGAGEFLLELRERGAQPVGVDPAAGMRRLASAAGFTVRPGDAEHLPFASGNFEVVTAVNALQFADDVSDALSEFGRVLVPGGRVGIANWADAAHNDLDVIERAVAEADGTDPNPDDALRLSGGLEEALVLAGLKVSDSGIVDTPWTVVDEDMLVQGVLLGESPEFIADMWDVVVEAAAPFRVGTGYVLQNRFRWAVAVAS